MITFGFSFYFLQVTLSHAAALCRDGAIAFVCMDWRHMGELIAAGQAVFSELKNVCVWNKTNGGMGSFYRSKHELVFVFKVGTAHLALQDDQLMPEHSIFCFKSGFRLERRG